MRLHTGTASGDKLGQAVCILADVDGDGSEDYAVGAPNDSSGPNGQSGTVFLYSGATGQVLQTLFGMAVGDQFGFSAAAAEVDPSGTVVLLVGAPHAGNNNRGQVYAFNAATGQLLWTGDRGPSSTAVDFGWAVDFVSDENGDGYPEVIVSDPSVVFSPTELGAVYKLDGLTGAVLASARSWNPLWSFGLEMHAFGDLDGDGFKDFGAKSHNRTLLEVYSSASMARLWSYQTRFEDGRHTFCGVENADPTGLDDVLVLTSYFPGSSGSLRRLDENGNESWFFDHPQGSNYSEVFSISDWDQDGSDLVIATEWDSNASAWVSSTMDPQDPNLQSHFQQSSQPFAGIALEVLGSRHPYLVYGDPNFWLPGMGNPGRVTVWEYLSFLEADAAQLSNSSGGTVTFDFDFPASEAGAFYVLLASYTGTGPTYLSGVAVPLTSDPLFQAMVNGNPPSQYLQSFGTLDGQGAGQAFLTTNPGDLSSLVGSTLFHAVVSLDPPNPNYQARLSSEFVSIQILP